ncbi:DoxX family protein [Patescibacteria group bacterium]|nr:DoxX family protein [Patescibacteria group bacterium]MCL5114654.1 DoxX family protein [Patescibacteria group bacterium]
MIQLLLIWSDWGILFLRVVLGLIFIRHGLPKMKDLKATGESFASMGFKPGRLWGTLVAILEVIGGLALIAGFFTQIVAALFVIEFIVIIAAVKRKSGFVGGYEFDLLILASAVLLVFLSGGSLSIDRLLGILLW